MPPQTPILLLDNLFDTVTQYPTAVVTASSARVGYEVDRLADYRRERTSWQAIAASSHTLVIDLGAGAAQPADSLFIDRGHNLAGVTVYVAWSDDGTTYTTISTHLMPVAGTLGGDPNVVLSVTEEGAAYTFWTLTGAHRYWRVTLSKGSTFVPVVPGLILGARLQLFNYSAKFDEDQSERTQSSVTSTAGYRGTDTTYSWRTVDLDLRYIGATEYDDKLRAARPLMFDRNEPWVCIMDYGTHPERAWMYQYDGTTWSMPKTRVYRAGMIRGREVGASLG